MGETGEGLKAVFIAGGAGTRLWPLSRGARPKQFHALAGESSLMRQTVERVLPVIPAGDVWVVTGASYVEQTRAELPEVPAAQVIGEPFPLGTNLAVGLGALHVARRDPEAVIFVGLKRGGTAAAADADLERFFSSIKVTPK